MGEDRKHARRDTGADTGTDADLDPGSGETTDERSVSSIPLDTEDGEQVVITQQNMAGRRQMGGGEWKDVDRGPSVEEAAAEQDELEREAPIHPTSRQGGR